MHRPVPPLASGTRLQRAGLWLRDHQPLLFRIQWGVVAVYAFLLVVPVILPLPGSAAHIWSNLTLFAQFVFWGLWWPGVLISVLLFGRLWCGVFCPEGALTAFTARRGQGRAVPRWLRWPGWPFAAFVLTTVYGQLISVYQYPAPALLILGGSTLAAMMVGHLYGRNKRVWCRYLCPVNGVFGLLARLAPLHFAVDSRAWDACPPDVARLQRFNCEPLVPVRTMESASPCHMCGRCAGFRGAVSLEARLPGAEVVTVGARTANGWDSLLIIVGLLGVATAAFQWSASPWFVALKQLLAGWLVGAGQIWPLQTTLPWWLLTNYPEQNDALSVLDGLTMLIYLAGVTLILTLSISLPIALATRLLGPWRWGRFHHLTQSLIPTAACGVILGLSALTVTMLRAEGLMIDVGPARGLALAGAACWSIVLAVRIIQRSNASPARRGGALALCGAALLPPIGCWVLLFWIW